MENDKMRNPSAAGHNILGSRLSHAIPVVAAGCLLLGMEGAQGFTFNGPNGTPRHWTGCGTTMENCPLVVTFNKARGFRPTVNFSLRAATQTWAQRDVAVDNAGNPIANIAPVAAPVQTIAGHDAESVLVHELGHALGLGHPNLADRVITTNALGAPVLNIAALESMDATIPVTAIPWKRLASSTLGDDSKYHMLWPELIGQDGIMGSADDVRDGDRSTHYVDSDNNPFNESDAIVDSGSFSPSKPLGRPQAPTREVAAGKFGFGPDQLEAIMVQGADPAELQRRLSYDDLNGINYLQAGVDQIAGTDDDYTFQLVYDPLGYTNVGGDMVGPKILLSEVKAKDFLAATTVFNRYGSYIFALIEEERDVYSDLVISRSEIWLTEDNCTTGLCIAAVDIIIPRTAPEPPTLALLGLGLAGLVLRRAVPKMPAQVRRSAE